MAWCNQDWHTFGNGNVSTMKPPILLHRLLVLAMLVLYIKRLAE